MEKPELLVVGSHAPGIFMRVKRVPIAGETIIGWDYQEPIDGGKGSNQAIAASRLGVKVAFIGCVGKDSIGFKGKQLLDEEGIDTTFLQFHETISSGVGFILLDEQGIPAMVTSIGANAEIQRRNVIEAVKHFSTARILLTQFEIEPEIALLAAEVAREHGLVSIINPAPAVNVPLSSLQSADVLLPNETEAKLLLGIDPGSIISGRELVVMLRKKTGVEHVIITLGDKGIIAEDKNGIWEVLPQKVNAIDTSGAGDVYCAAFSVALINKKNVRDAAAWACDVATYSVMSYGTIPSFPFINQINCFLKAKGG